MDPDELEIEIYLQRREHDGRSALDICRLAGSKKRFARDPDWAKPALARMVHHGIVEIDACGHYRLKPTLESRPQAGQSKTQRWISPQIREILLRSGKDFSELLGDQDDPSTHPPPVLNA
jgi:hypothetical protein